MLQSISPTKEKFTSKTYILGIFLSVLLIIFLNYPLFNNILLLDLNKDLIDIFKFDVKAYYLVVVFVEKMIVSVIGIIACFIPFFLRKSSNKLNKLLTFYLPYILFNLIFFYSLLVYFSIGFENLNKLLIINNLMQ